MHLPTIDNDLSPETSEDPHSVPTSSVVGNPARAAALEAFTEARKALGDGDAARAVQLLEEASRRDPDDPLYPRYIRQVQEELARREPEPPSLAEAPSPARRLGGKLALAVVIILVLALTTWAVARADGLGGAPDRAPDFQALAPFTRLQAAPGGGWMGGVDHPLAGMDDGQRRAWCRSLLVALPPADQPSLLLRSTDGQVVTCSR